jgi:hypothetical protein
MYTKYTTTTAAFPRVTQASFSMERKSSVAPSTKNQDNMSGRGQFFQWLHQIYRSRLFFGLTKILLPMIDVLTDVVGSLYLASEGHLVWSLATLSLIIFPPMMTSILVHILIHVSMMNVFHLKMSHFFRFSLTLKSK